MSMFATGVSGTDSSIITVALAALAVFIVVLVISGIWIRSRTTFLRVSLSSRKLFSEFDPEVYLLNLGHEEFKPVKNMLLDNRKKVLKVIWRYTSPSGRVDVSDSCVFKLDYVERYVKRMEPVFTSGADRVNGLNALYADLLASGVEANDGIPTIYCYRINDAEHNGLVKVGYASGSALKRIRSQLQTAAHLKVDYEVLFVMPALTISGATFKDHVVHKVLRVSGVGNPMGEWFECGAATARKAVNKVQFNSL